MVSDGSGDKQVSSRPVITSPAVSVYRQTHGYLPGRTALPLGNALEWSAPASLQSAVQSSATLHRQISEFHH